MHDFRDKKAKRRDMVERWAIFFVGVAIGCVILGIYFTGKQRARQHQQNAPQQSQP